MPKIIVLINWIRKNRSSDFDVQCVFGFFRISGWAGLFSRCIIQDFTGFSKNYFTGFSNHRKTWRTCIRPCRRTPSRSSPRPSIRTSVRPSHTATWHILSKRMCKVTYCYLSKEKCSFISKSTR